MQTELLARLVELASIIAAKYKIKKPLDVPRPKHLTVSVVEQREQAIEVQQGGMDKAFALMARTARPNAGGAG